MPSLEDVAGAASSAGDAGAAGLGAAEDAVVTAAHGQVGPGSASGEAHPRGAEAGTLGVLGHVGPVDIANTPSPAGPIPIPYPDVDAMTADAGEASAAAEWAGAAAAEDLGVDNLSLGAAAMDAGADIDLGMQDVAGEASDAQQTASDAEKQADDTAESLIANIALKPKPDAPPRPTVSRKARASETPETPQERALGPSAPEKPALLRASRPGGSSTARPATPSTPASSSIARSPAPPSSNGGSETTAPTPAPASSSGRAVARRAKEGAVPLENVRHEPKPALVGSAGIARLAAPVEEEGSSGRNLASAGGAVSHDDSGITTITFGVPSEGTIQHSASEPTLAREAAPASPGPSGAAAASPTGHGASGGGGGADIDEIYEQVVERLKREAIWERERRGDLHGDLP